MKTTFKNSILKIYLANSKLIFYNIKFNQTFKINLKGVWQVTAYSIDFAEKLASTASDVITDGLIDVASVQTVIYLSLLSTEISLKAMLEQAGMNLKDIRSCSHDISKLIKALDRCKISVNSNIVSAGRLRSKNIAYSNTSKTLGAIVDTDPNTQSHYPNQIRYGDSFISHPPVVMAEVASVVLKFAKKHWHDIHI